MNQDSKKHNKELINNYILKLIIDNNLDFNER